jgi:hypothetical protein
MAQQPLLRDVIDIKESISTSDFVLSLAEATTPEGAQHALKDYVVTERLLENFDEALALIKSALDGHRSKAAYLHGSFGSGKSHFMAVLYTLLSGDPAARSRTEFDPGADQARVAEHGRQEVPARALPHARREGPGAARPRWVRAPRQEAGP